MMRSITALVLVGLAGVCHCFVEPTDLPPELATCLQDYKTRSNDTMAGEAECFDQFVWKTHRIRWADYNVTAADLEFLSSLTGSFLETERRVRRTPQGPPRNPIGPTGMFPTTGFRVRTELRRATDIERSAFFKAVNVMKARGQYDIFARIHTGIVIQSAHFGPNFFCWHRIFLAIFEEALRRINPRAFIPYWDTTLDFHMQNPVDSIIWSPRFFGNGDGYVRTGPFANWRAINGDRLTRDINGEGILLSRPQISQLLSRCRTSEVVYPTALPKYNADFIHGGPHNWVGGQMAGLNTAANDPIFFCYHAFIDYIWELFRINQARKCGVNPNTDLPYGTGVQNPKRPLDGFPAYRAINGYSPIWTRAWYRYERSPTCGYKQPKCGSPYLRCDMRNQACISVRAPRGASGYGGGAGYGAGGAGYAAAAVRADSEERTVRVGRRFPSPPPDPRSNSVRLGRGRGRRAAVEPTNVPAYNVEIAAQDFSVGSEVAFSERVQTDVIPSPSEFLTAKSQSNLQAPIENTFMIDDVYDKSAWVYMPVKVISLSGTFASQYLKAANNAECHQDVSGAKQIMVKSQGITYAGTYVDQALADSIQPVSVAVTYIGVKDPRDQPSDVLITASGPCSTCQAQCLVAGSNPAQYQPCEGAVKLTNTAPLMFDKTIEGAAAIAWKWTGSTIDGPAGDIPIVFTCA